jgi:hypothetical protein
MSRHPLAREVAAVVAVKLAIVVAAALFVFGPKQRPAVDDAGMQVRILGPAQPGSERRSTFP